MPPAPPPPPPSRAGWRGALRCADLWLAAGAAVALGWVFFDLGIFFSPDSALYLSYAVALQAGGGLIVHPFWPPLYPMLLAGAMLLVGDPDSAASLVAGASLLATGLLLLLLLRRAGVPQLARLALLGVFLLDSGLFASFTYALSEGPFLAFQTGALYLALRHLETRRLGYYAGCASCVAAVATLRYMGYFLIASFAVYTAGVLLFGSPSRRERARLLAVFPLCFLPSLAYLARNWMAHGTLHGARPEGAVSLAANASGFVELLAAEQPVLLALGLTGAVAALVAAVATRRTGTDRFPAIAVCWLLVCSLLYSACIVVATASAVRGSPVLVERYLTPLVLLLLLLVGIGWSAAGRALPRVSAPLASVPALLLLLVSAGTDGRELRGLIHEVGVADGLHVVHFRTSFDASATARELRGHLDQALAETGQLIAVPLVRSDRPHVSRTLFFRRALLGKRRGCRWGYRASTGSYWVRCREPEPVAIEIADPPSAADLSTETFLEDLRGWMRALGGRARAPIHLFFVPSRPLDRHTLEATLGPYFTLVDGRYLAPYVVGRLVPHLAGEPPPDS